MAKFRTREGSKPLLTLLVANILPLLVGIFLVAAYYRGDITFVPEAGNVMPSLILLGLALVVLVVLAWVIAPVLMPAARAALDFVRSQKQAIKRGGLSELAARLPFLAGGSLIYVVLWFNVCLVCALIIVDVLAVIGVLTYFVLEVWHLKN